MQGIFSGNKTEKQEIKWARKMDKKARNPILVFQSWRRKEGRKWGRKEKSQNRIRKEITEGKTGSIKEGKRERNRKRRMIEWQNTFKTKRGRKGKKIKGMKTSTERNNKNRKGLAQEEGGIKWGKVIERREEGQKEEGKEGEKTIILR